MAVVHRIIKFDGIANWYVQTYVDGKHDASYRHFTLLKAIQDFPDATLSIDAATLKAFLTETVSKALPGIDSLFHTKDEEN